MKLVGGCLALAALSLLWSRQPTYDPWSWLIWGREIADGTLSTDTGPSWKPLPIVFTTPFSLAGDTVAPMLWVVVARAGGLLAIAMTYRLAARFGGRLAGVVAAVGLAIAFEFLRNAALGNSEGLLVALSLAAIERHLDGHRGHAFGLGFAAALLRPEIWLFWVPYGVWLAWRDPSMRARVVAAFAAIPVVWFVPEWIGSGNPFRAADRAREPLPDSPAFAEHPALEVLERSLEILAPPVLVFAAIALALRHRTIWWFGGAALALVVTVALMTEAGFSGNLRYVQLPAALACVLAGVGVAAVAERRAVLAVVLLAASLPFLIEPLRNVGDDVEWVQLEGDWYEDLPEAIALAGGERAIRDCGDVYTAKFEVPAITWKLHLEIEDVTVFVKPPGVVIVVPWARMARDPRFEGLGRTKHWVVRRACAS